MKKIVLIFIMLFVCVKVNALEVNISKSNNNSLKITWKDDGSSKYKVLKSTKKNGKYKQVINTDKNSYIDYGLTYGKTYYYKVIGKKTSKIVYKKVVPNKVNNLKIVSYGANNIKISYDKVNVTGYQIYRSTNKKKWTLIKTTSINSYNNTKLKNNKTYYYKVRAYKKVNKKKIYGTFSNIVSVKTNKKGELISKINNFRINYSKKELIKILNVSENIIDALNINFNEYAYNNLIVYMNLYSFSEDELIKQLNLYDKFENSEIEYALNKYNGEYGNNIANEEYKHRKDLYILGYSHEEIDFIINNFNFDEINKYLNIKKYNNLTSFKNSKYFNIENIDRYQNYYNKNKYSEDESVLYVEIGLDNEFYTNMKKANVDDGKLILVNKYYYVDKDYYANTETLGSGYGSGSLNKEAAKYFREMVKEAKKDGIKLYSVSAYRSYSTQKNLYNRYVRKDGKKKADTYSARPGHSEHNLGLAVDINCASSSRHFENTKEYKWLKDNSYKYGFIERYPKGKEFITGYKYEPWHFRYLGSEVATEVYNLNVTYEEYVVIKKSL